MTVQKKEVFFASDAFSSPYTERRYEILCIVLIDFVHETDERGGREVPTDQISSKESIFERFTT